MSFVEVGVEASTGVIILKRPEKRNALCRQMLQELSEAFDDLHQEKQVRGVLLTGDGEHFCAGLDLGQMHATSLGDPQAALATWHQDWMQLTELLITMLRFPKAIVSAVDGVAFGGGLALVLASDLAVATNRSRFCIPAVRRGLIGGAVSPLLNFRTGAKTAARMLLTAEEIPAEEAYRLHMIDELVDPEKLLDAAKHRIEQVAAAPNEAIQLSKRLLNETVGEQLLTQLSVGAAMGATACTTEAAAEGLAAFAEDREPNWP